MRILYLLLLILPISTFSQNKKLNKADRESLSEIESENKLLASAPDQIISYMDGQFKKVGLSPLNATGFIQVTNIDAGKKIQPTATSFEVNNQQLVLEQEFFPLVFSANGSAKSETSPSIREANSAWFLDVKDWISDNATNTQYNISKAIYEEAKKVAKRKAQALIVYNSSGKTDNITFDKTSDLPPVPIPVVYVTSAGMKKHFNDDISTYDVSLKVNITADKQTKTNVTALLNNKSANTIVICTPYTQGFTNGVNPSGVTALAALASYLKKSKNKNNNYLFVVFSDNTMNTPSFEYWPAAALSNMNISYAINLGNLGNYNTAKELAINNVPSNQIETFNIAASNTLNVKFNKDNISPSTIPGNQNTSVFFVNTQENMSPETDALGELEITHFIQKLVESGVNK